MSTAKTIRYYSTLGSRVGYTLVAGGHRHFGYYGDKQYRYIPNAAKAMIDYLAKYADIKSGEKVLDAGCGEGRAALQIAKQYNAKVTGIDVVPLSISIAKRRAEKSGTGVHYLLGDYNKLPFDNESFDVVFTLETFTHTENPQQTLNEFRRVLKPGGRIVIFDYSIKNIYTVDAPTKEALMAIAKHTNCPSFIAIDHDYYKDNLPKMGFSNFEVQNLTNAVMPSLRQIHALSWLPYQILKLTKQVGKHPNTLIAHFGMIWAKSDVWRYVTVKITKD